jgi:hypothetical protein
MLDNEMIYQELQQNLDKVPVGFPSAEDGSDIKVLKAFFCSRAGRTRNIFGFYTCTST